TTAGTSARRSARRSGSTEPVIDGPEVSAELLTTNTSSRDTSRAGGGASASLPSPLPQPASEMNELTTTAASASRPVMRILFVTRDSFERPRHTTFQRPNGLHAALTKCAVSCESRQ